MSIFRRISESIVGTKEAIKHKGDIGEAERCQWLGGSGFSYVAICQARESFAPLFTGQIKRPEFMVLLDSIGLIAVDAKNFDLRSRGRLALLHTWPAEGAPESGSVRAHVPNPALIRPDASVLIPRQSTTSTA